MYIYKYSVNFYFTTLLHLKPINRTRSVYCYVEIDIIRLIVTNTYCLFLFLFTTNGTLYFIVLSLDDSSA